MPIGIDAQNRTTRQNNQTTRSISSETSKQSGQTTRRTTRTSVNNEERQNNRASTRNDSEAFFADTKTSNVIKKADDDIVLVVEGEGKDKTEATKNALRSAIEQTYGTFVSANTEILNDDLVKDEIVTIASGNIKSYKELSSLALPNGNTSVSLSAVVSIGKLVSYAKSKGASAEFAGETFMMEMKMYELNKENEKKALNNLLRELDIIAPKLYDYKLTIGNPKQKQALIKRWISVGGSIENGYSLPMIIHVSKNNNYTQWMNHCCSVINALSLSDKECTMAKNSNITYGTIKLDLISGKQIFYLRQDNSFLTEYIKDLSKRINSGLYAWKLEEKGANITYSPSFLSLKYDANNKPWEDGRYGNRELIPWSDNAQTYIIERELSEEASDAFMRDEYEIPRDRNGKSKVFLEPENSGLYVASDNPEEVFIYDTFNSDFTVMDVYMPYYIRDVEPCMKETEKKDLNLQVEIFFTGDRIKSVKRFEVKSQSE